MRIGLYNIDHTAFPNLALMKVAAHHRAQGDTVEMYSPLWYGTFDRVYAFSVFTFSDKSYVTDDMICGGTGFDLHSALPPDIEATDPDYSMYPLFTPAIGFTTRGCIRRCPFCFVPEKEGAIRPDRDVEQIAQGRSELVLIDNNFLAAGDYAMSQAEKIIRNRYKVDFNQGLDARLIDDDWARTLALIEWTRFIRLACDSDAALDSVIRAAELIRKHAKKRREIFVYVLVTDIDSALHRVTELRKHNLDPFAQPYRDPSGKEPPDEHKHFARWVNHKAVFKSCTWDEYQKSVA